MAPAADETQSFPSRPDDPLPTNIGRYVIQEQLGAGGMGTVYKAHDPQLDRVVALKLPRFDGPARDRDIRIQRFQREARAAAQIWHPHVCPIHDVGEHEGQPFVVMAYVPGQSLADRLADKGRYEDTAEAVALMRQILDALEAVHKHGIIHRDLKPGNILIDAAGRAVLTDFGLARPAEDAEHLTSEGVILGTPSYMAPEQAAGEANQIGPGTDVYSLGAVLYQMLTGQLPFTGTTPAVLARIIHDEPPMPHTIRPDLDPGLEKILLRALRKSVADRYPDAQAFRAALDDWSAAHPSSSNSPLAYSTDTVRIAERERPKPLLTPEPTPSMGRRFGWLIGGVFLTAGFGLLACVPLVMIAGESDALLAFALSAFLTLLLGCLLWFLLKGTHEPAGLRAWAKLGEIGQVKRAIANGVSPDVPDEMGDTALMIASAAGRREVVKILLVQGANAQLRNAFGQTAEEIARAAGHEEIASLFRKHDPTASTSVLAGTPTSPAAFGRGLLAAALLGSILAVGLYWWIEPWPTWIGYSHFLHLVHIGQVEEARVMGFQQKFWIAGTIRDPDTVHLQSFPLHRGQFLTLTEEIVGMREEAFVDQLKGLKPGVRVVRSRAIRFSVQAPSAWAIVPMLAFPVAIAFLLRLLLFHKPRKRA